MVRAAIRLQHKPKLGHAFIVSILEIEKGMSVCEIGSGGSGHFVLPIARKVGETGQVYAVEAQQSLLDTLESRAVHDLIYNIDFIHANAEQINGTRLESDSMDCVLFINSLHQMDEKRTALREAARILKPNGKMLIVEWDEKMGCPHPSLESYCFSPHEIEADITQAGLVHIDKFSVAPYYWGLLLGL